MYCKECNEHMDGDGYTSVLRCPNASDEEYAFHEPDANPVYCGFKECTYCNGTGKVEGFKLDGGPVFHWMKPKVFNCYKCEGTGVDKDENILPQV